MTQDKKAQNNICKISDINIALFGLFLLCEVKENKPQTGVRKRREFDGSFNLTFGKRECV